MNLSTKLLQRECALWLTLAVTLCAPLTAGARDSQTIEIYEHYGHYTLANPPADMRPIVLQIPEAFRYGSTKGSIRNWGANILTYYPSFTSPAEPENAKYGLHCIGICNGRILVAVNNGTHSISAVSPNMGDYIARSTLKWQKTGPYPSNIQVHDLAPVGEFDEGFERVATAPENPSSRFVTRFYFRKAADKTHYDLAATCVASEARTTCTLHFSLLCNPQIYISVHGLDGTYLARASDIKEKADRFVSAMVKDPPCPL